MLDNVAQSDAFHLPERNEFIPTSLDITKRVVKEKQKKPDLIQETSMLRLWHKKDDTFWIPKTNVWILFRNPLTYATPRNAVIST